MSNEVVLAPDELVETRPFTDPQNSQDDLTRMRRMAQQLVDTYGDPVVCDFQPGKTPVCKSDPLGRHFRIYYIQPDLLFSKEGITTVGFFGIKRSGADIKPLLQADKQFEKEFHKHPGLLSLSTVRLTGGNFANLVLFTDPESKDEWNHSDLHYDLVRKISPPYYESIRLNNGFLPKGLSAPEELRLFRVKYIDYTTDPHWRAVRTME